MEMIAIFMGGIPPGEGFLRWKLGCQEPLTPGEFMTIPSSNLEIGGLQ